MAKLDKFITYAYLKEECDLPENLQDKKLEHPIYRAQEVVRMLMGDEFYQDFLTNYKASTLSALYTTLFPFIKQFVAWQAHEIWTQKANLSITQAGFRVHKEEHSEVASAEQMASIVRDAKYQSQFYKNVLVDFLNNHNTDYPLYNVDCNSASRGNSFKISVVRNKEVQPQPFGTNGTIKTWR